MPQAMESWNANLNHALWRDLSTLAETLFIVLFVLLLFLSLLVVCFLVVCFLVSLGWLLLIGLGFSLLDFGLLVPSLWIGFFLLTGRRCHHVQPPEVLSLRPRLGEPLT